MNDVLNNRITDYQLVEYCENILENYYADMDSESMNLTDLEREILEDISAQWELMIVNSFPENELASLDIESVKFPQQFLEEWIKRLK